MRLYQNDPYFQEEYLVTALELITKNYHTLNSQAKRAIRNILDKVLDFIGAGNYKKEFYDFGFTKPISINFPSSAFGYMAIKDKIVDKELASLGYGYGLTISPFQIASAYSVFANNGIFKDFKLLKNEDVSSRRVISESTASNILKALENGKKVMQKLSGCGIYLLIKI